jgi:hypothetical protein
VRRAATTILITVLALGSIVYAQDAPTLRVSGPDGRSIALTVHDLEAMPHRSADVVDDQSNHATYEGVPVFEVLRRVGAPFGRELRGQKMAFYLLVSASDGYHAVFAIAELDPDFTNRLVLLAYRRDGKELSTVEGPFRIIVPDEKRHARWVRNITSLSIKRAE